MTGRTLVALLLIHFLVLDQEVDKVLVVHDLLILHGYNDPHLILERLKCLHQHLAIFDESHYYLVIVPLHLVLVPAGRLIYGYHLAEPGQHLVGRQYRQLLEARLDVTSRAQECGELLRLVEVGKPRDVLHEFVEEEAALLHEVVLSIPDRLLLRDRRHVQTHEPREKDIPEEVELFVSPKDLKLAEMVAAPDLVQVMLTDCVILDFGFYYLDVRRLVLFARHQILEGRDHRGNEDRL